MLLLEVVNDDVHEEGLWVKSVGLGVLIALRFLSRSGAMCKEASGAFLKIGLCF